MTNDIQFSKGSYSVDLHSDEVNEEYNNKLIILTIPQSTDNQASGAEDNRILDLLQITHQFVITAYIAKNSTKSAKQQKDDLIQIAKGAEIDGGTVEMTFDGDTYIGYLEKIIITKKAMDSPDTESDEEIKYKLQITFVVGTSLT